MKNFLELVENRYSVRGYLPKSVSPEQLEYILDCALLAPSACNLQPWKIFVIVDDGAVKDGIRASYEKDWFKQAPAYLVVCKDVSRSWKRKNYDHKDFADVDVAIAAEHICLAVADIGLGTCWICNFNPKQVTEVLSLPSNIEPVALFPIGFIDDTKCQLTPKVRLAGKQVVTWL